MLRKTSILPLLFLAVLMAGCGGGGHSAMPVSASATGNPLIAQYVVNAPAGSQVSVEFGASTAYGRRTSAKPAPANGGDVTILVVGMRPSTTYHMRARITLANGSTELDGDRTFTTGALDMARFPTLTVTGDTSTGRGVELINLATQDAGKIQDFVTDLDGTVIWFYDHPDPEGFVFVSKQLPNDDLLMLITDFTSNGILREVDLAGQTIRQYTLDNLNQALSTGGFNFTATFFHHDVIALPNRHYVLLVGVNKTYTDLNGFPGDTVVEGDALVDLDPNFNLTWVWNAFDHLDVNRHPLGFPPDWTHSNAIVYTADKNLLLSMRNQNWILKIDYQDGTGSGNILWRLGNEGDFTLTGGDVSKWFYAQHYPSIVSTNGSVTKLAVFDDGNNRLLDQLGTICGGGNPCYSRTVIYDVDEGSLTATVDWEHLPGLFTPWGGSINQLQSTNVEYDLSGPVQLPGSRVEEVTQTLQPQLVWRMDMSVSRAYRAYRIPSLYQGVQW